jgi:hypothetical protein
VCVRALVALHKTEPKEEDTLIVFLLDITDDIGKDV